MARNFNVHIGRDDRHLVGQRENFLRRMKFYKPYPTVLEKCLAAPQTSISRIGDGDLGKRSNYSIGLRVKRICPVEGLQNMSSQIFQAIVGSKPRCMRKD